VGAASFAAALLLTAGIAHAEPTASQIAAARELGKAGVMAAQAGDCATAVDKLSRAEALYSAPTQALPLGECLVKLGKIVAGTEVLNRLVRQQLPPNSSPSWFAAQTKAKEVLAAATPKIAKLKIHVQTPPGSGTPQVTIDNEPMDAALLDNDRPSDPGTRAIRVTATGCLPKDVSVTLDEGGSQSVNVQLDPDPNASKTPEPTPPDKPATPDKPAPPIADSSVSGPPPNKTFAYVMLGTGIVGVGVGGVFGFMALGSKSSLDDNCINKVCPASQQSSVDSLHTNALISTGGMIVGVIGIGVGGYLLLSYGRSSPAPAKTARVQVAPWIGPTSVGVVGRFE
jgi:hypothetical protein